MRKFLVMLLMFAGIMTVGSQNVFAATKEKALVVVSFGTTFKETRELDIESLEKSLAAAFPDRDFKRAFTAKIVMKRLFEKDAIKVYDLATVLEKLYKEGYKDVLVQPTHLTPGEEIANKVMPAIKAYQNKFAKLSLGTPLLTDKNDFPLVVKALETTMPKLLDDEIVVFMGHGSPNIINPAYKSLEDSFKKHGFPALIGVVEETDELNFGVMLKKLKESKAKKVLLMPLMLVAGDHAHNDMVGNEADSWINLLKKEGYEVRFEIRGIGRNIAIQNIYIMHALASH